ncbi:serine/threonine-protein kinase M1 [Xanthoria calcicola]
MLASKRALSHCEEQAHLDLTASVLGQCCLQALRSSSRDLRIAAGRTLPSFLRSDLDDVMLRRNSVSALDFLRNLSERSELASQETCILAWGQIARVSSGDEMNIILLRLVEYLGHTNPLVCGLAYDEIQRMCQHSSFSVHRLLSSYWRTLAPTVAQDLQRLPQIAQYLADLMSNTVSELLRLTQIYTLPYLVSTKQQSILQRVADACNRSIKDLCMEPANTSAILAYLLLRSPSDAEVTIITALQSVSSEFMNVDCAELIKAEPVLIASELLKTAGDADDATKPKSYAAINILASLSYGKHGTPRGTARKSNMTGLFFDTHVLGIMAHLSDTINESKGVQITAEKIRCLRAVQEMMRVAKSHVNNALPQISACLRSALENTELCNEAFVSWTAMIGASGADEILSLIDPTFAIVVQYWDSLTPQSQTKAYNMISELLKTHATSVREQVHTIPSLSSIPVMAKFDGEIGSYKIQMAPKHQLQALIQRSNHENMTVVLRALVELEVFLQEHQTFLHESSISEHPDPVVSELARTLLDISIRYSESDDTIVILSARCLGLLGCLDPTRIEAPRENQELLVLSNFQEAEETIDFVIFFLQEVLVKAFLSATNPRAQGFLAYAMQELLKFCGLNGPHTSRNDTRYIGWVNLSESVRNTLTPFLTSKYVVTAAAVQPEIQYPIYRPSMGHGLWLRTFVYDLLRKGHGDNIMELFQVFSRIIRTQDTPISTFLLPFAVLNIIISGMQRQQLEVAEELLTILSHPLPEGDIAAKNGLLHCSQNVFQVLDYLSRWVQEKKKNLSIGRLSSSRSGRTPSSNDIEIAQAQIYSVESVVSTIPAEMISGRAVECKSYSRALFYWEQHIRQQKSPDGSEDNTRDIEPLYERLQQIYTQIDEPDGIEGISSYLQVLNIDQQILEHRKAGRWTAAQSWYELLLSERPRDTDVQYNLLTCLKESGQHDVLLNQIDGFESTSAKSPITLPFACEAAWVTGKWNKLEEYVGHASEQMTGNFNIGIGQALLALARNEKENFIQILGDVRRRTARTLSATNTASLQACHSILLRFHALTEIEAIGGARTYDGSVDKSALTVSLDQRLDLLGAFNSDKQFLLGLRRAVMQSSRDFSNNDIASSWLTSAKLARKAGFTHQSFNAVLHASQLGDNSATIEHSRLLWKEGHHRKAIQSLRGAIAANAFQSHAYLQLDQTATLSNNRRQQEQNFPKARAHLLLAKWIDGAGQTQSQLIIEEYRLAIRWYTRWEKAHYYLGKHYNKLLEHEKAKMTSSRSQTFVNGEMAKLVVENYIRSLAFGAKYIHQTLPRALTLWLELGIDAELPLDSTYGNDEFRTHVAQQRRKMLAAVNSQVKKYSDRLPGFAFYTAFSQIVARIVHPNPAVIPLLIEIVAKVVIAHPEQALWTLLAVVKSSSKDRALRGKQCLDRIQDHAKRATDGKELKAMITHGQKLSDQLLHVCEGDIQGKASTISLSKDLGFVHKMAPCRLVVPLESTLTASLPLAANNVDMRKHRAFSRDTVTISAFLDDVLVLNSLQKPRKIKIRGSDGNVYALLCKPKDDLRKDQRLMEFNTMINRFLKKDAASSQRRLYIKTYSVTPLNEECGLIEWVDNLKTLREILLNAYRQRNIILNYGELKMMLNEACAAPKKTSIFTHHIIPRFPPVFHEWFVDMFPEPGAWFAARLRYTRSCAVMSIVGHVLGLGDRHGENILFEEGNGGTFHVDFNCLFDKGLSFEKPELVPFRLTHNMVDAFGAYGCEGPFRKSCELTLRILRQHADTLMTILETFLYDPTTDFIGGKGKKIKGAADVVAPDTPEGVLDSVRNKVRGLLPGESVPLSVEGYVEVLIKQATDPERLAAMYIGWCAFF